MNRSTPGLPVHHQLPESTQTHVHWVDDAIQPSHPLSSPSPPALYLSQHQGLFSQSALHIRWSEYWSFSFNISPSNEHPGLISFRMDWLDLLTVQGTLKSLLQHHSSKASILLSSANQSVTTLWDLAFRSHSFQNPLSQSHSLGVWGTTGIWGKDDSLIHGILPCVVGCLHPGSHSQKHPQSVPRVDISIPSWEPYKSEL